MTSDHPRSGLMGLEPTHRSEPGLEPAVVALDPVVVVLADVVRRSRNQVLDRVRQSRGRGDVRTLGHVHVDDLALLVDRPVHVAPDAGDLDIGLVDEPAILGQMPTGPRCVDQQWREALHPSVERDVVDLDATLGEQLFEIPVGQPVAQVSAHPQQDHLGREPESSEARGHPHRRTRAASALHRVTLTAGVPCSNATEPSKHSSSIGNDWTRHWR